MTLYEMFSLIEYIGNKDFGGNIITPDRFGELIPIVNIDRFRKKHGLPEGYQPGRPIPVEYADITIKNTDDLKAFKTRLALRAVTNGIMAYPDDYAHRDTLVYNYTKVINSVSVSLPRKIEILREDEFAEREGSYTKGPTTYNPIGVMRSDGIHIRPISIVQADLNYYRWPTDPVFAYTEGDGYITYDAANSTELEWPVDEHLAIASMILQMVGVNLREADLVNYSESKLKNP